MGSAALTAVVMGDVNLDVGLCVDGYPVEGGDAQALTRVVGSGGGGLNAAVAMRSLGAEAVLLARVGSDALAGAALQTARSRGVDLSAVQCDPLEPTGTCVVVTSAGGERTLFSHRGANARLDAAGVQALPWSRCGLVYVSGYALLPGPTAQACTALLERAAHAAVPVAMDLGLAVVRACRQQVLQLLPRLGALTLNVSELLALTGQPQVEGALDWLAPRTAGLVAVKRGAAGCVVVHAGQRVHCPPRQVQAVDSTGCGDGFAAALALGWARGLDAASCGALGNTMGSWIAARRGAAEAIPDPEEIAPWVARYVAWSAP
jgi:sugar/nucleoside kinase (ribokinase family)